MRQTCRPGTVGCRFALEPPEDWQGTLCKAQGAGKGIRTCTDLYGLVRTIGTGLCGCPVPRKFHSTWLRALPAKCLTPAPCAWRSPENRAHSHRLAERIAQCRYWGQRMSDLSDLSDLSDDWHLVQSVPCALEFSKYIALTQPSAMSVSVRICPYSSVFPCPQYRHCAMCFASLPEARERSDSRPHGVMQKISCCKEPGRAWFRPLPDRTGK